MTEQTEPGISTDCKLYVGCKVQDEEGDIGTVVDCEDPHNIEVDFDPGKGMYCIVKECHRYDLLFVL